MFALRKLEMIPKDSGRIWVQRHRTPKGVRSVIASTGYKHCTPKGVPGVMAITWELFHASSHSDWVTAAFPCSLCLQHQPFQGSLTRVANYDQLLC
jgi:hypothetical protein